MKAVFSLPLLLIQRTLQALTMVLIVALCALVSVLMVFATPFWAFELATAQSWKLLRVTPVRDCESYLDWMYRPHSFEADNPSLNRVRLWGLEFEYVDWPEQCYHR